MIIATEQDEQERPERMAFSIADAAWVLGNISENHVRNLIKAKRLKIVPLGRRKMVTAESIRRLLEVTEQESEPIAA